MFPSPPLETSEQLTPEEEAEETEAWAKPLSQLWQNRPPNFEAEKEFNELMAQQAPHCAVCMIFQTYHQVSLPCCHQASRASRQEAGLNYGAELCHCCLCPLLPSPGQCFARVCQADDPAVGAHPYECLGLVILAHGMNLDTCRA